MMTRAYTVLAAPTRYCVLMPAAGNPPNFPAMTSYATKTLTVDLGNYLPPAVQLLPGYGSIVLSVKSGTDATPQSRLVAGPFVVTAPVDEGGTGLTNAAIAFQVQPLPANRTLVYLVTFEGFQRSDNTELIAFANSLPVNAPS